MISIRIGLFETNSSSVHVLVIPKDTDIHIPSHVNLYGGDYDWGPDSEDDTIQYFYQACKDMGKDELNKFFAYLSRKNIDFEEMSIKTKYFGGIDHVEELPLEELFNNENLLDRFLFGIGSYIDIGNDNCDNSPSDEDYDLDKYDIIIKTN